MSITWESKPQPKPAEITRGLESYQDVFQTVSARLMPTETESEIEQERRTR